MGCRPVTSKFRRKDDSSGNFTVDELVLKMLRQPRVVLAAVPASTVHPAAPLETRVLAKAILPCRPSVIGMGVAAVSAEVLTTVSAPQRESGQAAPGPVVGVAVPATYRLPPLSSPTVAPPGTGIGASAGAKVGDAVPKSTETTLEAVPPHS